MNVGEVWQLRCDPTYFVRIDGISPSGKTVHHVECDKLGHRKRSGGGGSMRASTFLTTYEKRAVIPPLRKILRMTNKAAMFSSKSDHWATPPDFYAELDREFGFTFDPCPLHSTEDGAKRSWSGRVFCNPPYSKIPQFIKRALWHLHSGEVELAVFLIPARTDTAWFHDYIDGKAEVRFCRGRLKFGGSKNSAPFPSMVVVFRASTLPPLPLEASEPLRKSGG